MYMSRNHNVCRATVRIQEVNLKFIKLNFGNKLNSLLLKISLFLRNKDRNFYFYYCLTFIKDPKQNECETFLFQQNNLCLIKMTVKKI